MHCVGCNFDPCEDKLLILWLIISSVKTNENRGIACNIEVKIGKKPKALSNIELRVKYTCLILNKLLLV